MQNKIETLDIKELEKLKKDYLAKIAEIDNQITKKENLVRAQLEQKRKDYILSEEQIKERVNKYLHKTNYSDIAFLDYNMRLDKSFNNKGYLSNTELIFLDEEMKKLVENYGITNKRQLFDIILDYQLHKKVHPILQDKNFIAAWNETYTLGYLDKIFHNDQNRLDYQGTYAAFQYVKKHIAECLATVAKENETEDEIVWKNFDKKKIIVTENIASIAHYVLIQRNQIPGARIFINNGGLAKTAKKKKESAITFPQERLAEAIAFGTTLEKLTQQNYEDAKQLIYVPKN